MPMIMAIYLALALALVLGPALALALALVLGPAFEPLNLRFPENLIPAVAPVHARIISEPC